jgi:hypothetical protein
MNVESRIVEKNPVFKNEEKHLDLRVVITLNKNDHLLSESHRLVVVGNERDYNVNTDLI